MVTKILAEKIGNFGRALEKMFEVWTRQVARPSQQTSSRSTDLAGQLAVWTRLNATFTNWHTYKLFKVIRFTPTQFSCQFCQCIIVVK